MPTGSIEFYVPRPPDEVFAYISDLENATQWTPDLTAMRMVTPEPLGVGSRYVETTRVGDRREDARLRVTCFDPPQAFEYAGDGEVARCTVRFTLHSDGGGTRVRHESRVHMKGCFWLLTPFVGGFVQKNNAEGLRRLQKILAGPMNKPPDSAEDAPEKPA